MYMSTKLITVTISTVNSSTKGCLPYLNPLEVSLVSCVRDLVCGINTKYK